jgi:hypothetical protein
MYRKNIRDGFISTIRKFIKNKKGSELINNDGFWTAVDVKIPMPSVSPPKYSPKPEDGVIYLFDIEFYTEDPYSAYR